MEDFIATQSNRSTSLAEFAYNLSSALQLHMTTAKKKQGGLIQSLQEKKMRSPRQLCTFCFLLVGLGGIAVFLGWWLLISVFKHEYPNLNVDCFQSDNGVVSNQTKLTTKVEGLARSNLTIYDAQDDSPIVSINAVHGAIDNPVFSPNHTLLLFSETGSGLVDTTIVRACNMNTGQQQFYILELEPVQGIAFSPDGSSFIIRFKNGAERQYETAIGSES